MAWVDPQPTLLPTCYRHPDRETRLACSACDRPVCVECVRPAAVGQRCPECAAAAGSRSRVLDMDDVRRARTAVAPVAFTVLGVSVALFVLQFLLPPVGGLVAVLAVQDNELVAAGQWWRLLTAAFIHAGPGHVLFNMWALYVLGPDLERRVGSAPFAALYAAAAASGGAVFYLLVPHGSAVGASGAIFGLFGAWLLAAFRSRHTTAGAAGFRQLMVLLGINLALPLVFPGIAWQAHLGGLVAGAALTLAWTTAAFRTAAARTVLGVAVAVAALAAVAVG